MDDIKAIIDASEHYKYRNESGTTDWPFNRLSSLPESKKDLKRAIKERIQSLVGAYISLATFVDDDLIDAIDKENIKKVSKLYKKVLKDMDILRREIEAYDPFSGDP